MIKICIQHSLKISQITNSLKSFRVKKLISCMWHIPNESVQDTTCTSSVLAPVCMNKPKCKINAGASHFNQCKCINVESPSIQLWSFGSVAIHSYERFWKTLILAIILVKKSFKYDISFSVNYQLYIFSYTSRCAICRASAKTERGGFFTFVSFNHTAWAQAPKGSFMVAQVPCEIKQSPPL